MAPLPLSGSLFGRLPPPTQFGRPPSVTPKVVNGTVGTVLPSVPASAYTSTTGSATSVGASAAAGRVGAGPPSVLNATSATITITDTAAASSDKLYNLQAVGDIVTMLFSLTVTATGNTDTVDILNAISSIVIYAPTIGPIITLKGNHPLASDGGNTVPGIYMLSQRFSEYGQLPSTVNVTSGSPTSASFMLAGFNLPAAKGPYSLEIVLNSTSGFSATTTDLSVTYSFGFKIGTCPGGARLRYVETMLASQPTANGSQDYGPQATIQDSLLTEYFWSGLVGATDIANLQCVVAGSVITQNTTGAQLQAMANSQLTANMPTGVLYPCLALNTGITLGRATTFLTSFSAAPATSGVWNGYCWHD
jgi:hypothetical protein